MRARRPQQQRKGVRATTGVRTAAPRHCTSNTSAGVRARACACACACCCNGDRLAPCVGLYLAAAALLHQQVTWDRVLPWLPPCIHTAHFLYQPLHPPLASFP